MCTQSVLLASRDYSVSEYAHVPNNFYKSGVPVLLHHYFWGRGLKTLGTPALDHIRLNLPVNYYLPTVV